MERFERTLEAANINVGTLTIHADGTVGPASEPLTEAELTELFDLAADSEFVLEGPIGEGGMGVVYAAQQASLGREVAVKALQPYACSPRRVRAFVREARVTGLLEHPNIIPVHGLVASAEGSPWMVMKRVRGTRWLEEIERTLGTPGHLETHLAVLRAVCNALEAAHDRGVVHRDVKPENVLVGSFGEVLVVDWGLACAVGDPPVAGMPRTIDCDRPEGTPSCMAPEMAIGDGETLSERTDVYLLGATLHHLLTGTPRHDGETLMQLLFRAFVSARHEYGPEVPEELGAIANRACAADPAERYPDVRSFRRALAEYESHAASTQLAARTAARLNDARGEDLSACRYGFEQALWLWPDNPAARRGLLTTLEREAEAALERNHVEQARGLLAQIERLAGDAESGLRERLQALRRELARREARISALERRVHEQDYGAGFEKRRAFGIGFAALFLLYNVGLGIAAETGSLLIGHSEYTVGAFFIALLFLVAVWRYAPALTPNRASRRLLAGIATIVAAQVPVFLVLGMVGVDIRTALAVSLLQLAGSFTLQTLGVEERMVWLGPATALLGVVALWLPSTSFFLVAVAYATFFTVGALWRVGSAATSSTHSHSELP